MMFKIPFIGRGHTYTEDEVKSVLETMQNGITLTQGVHKQNFQKKFCEFTGAKYAFALNNATAALELSAQLCQFKSDDEVIIPSHTFTASAYPFLKKGAKIAIVTAKDKLRKLLSHGLKFNDARAICFSSEKSDQATKNENGIDNINNWLGMKVPDVYSQDLSEFVMASGVKILSEFKPDIMYLSTTDFIQHKYAPGDEEANKFYAMFDKYIGQLNVNNNSIIITADHGMQSKSKSDGSPNAIFLQDVLDKKFGARVAKVILPITDPYVVHHGALGSFATVYLEDKSKINEAINEIKTIKDIEVVVTNEMGCREYDLPKDRMGDIICMSSKNMTIGSSESAHDLSKLKEPLRSHGGLHEREVPFISNKKINSIDTNTKLNNYDAFYYAIAGAM